jgi:hypothetical protein
VQLKNSGVANAVAWLFIVLTIVGMIWTFISSRAEAAEPFEWQNPGDNPFADTRAEAMARREEAFRRLGFTEAQIEAFILQTDKPSAVVQIHSGSTLGGMVGGGGKDYFDFPVNFVRAKPSLPVSAEAEMWQIEWEGQIYTIYLPTICNNWAFKVESAQCAVAQYETEVGDEFKFVVLTEGSYLPASACWEVCDGESCSAPPTPCTDGCNWSGIRESVPAEFSFAAHSGAYTTKSRLQTIRFPREVMQEYLGACVTRNDAQHNGILVRPEDWVNGRASAGWE